MARMNAYGGKDAEAVVYPGHHWQWAFVGGSYLLNSQGYDNIDRRGAFAYAATGNTPGHGVERWWARAPQYIWAARDAKGNFLDGKKDYRLRDTRQSTRQGLLVCHGLRYKEPFHAAKTGRNSPPSASTPAPRRMRTARLTSFSAPRHQPARRRTGSVRCPTVAGSRSCASMAPCSRSSTRHGNPKTSLRSPNSEWRVGITAKVNFGGKFSHLYGMTA